MKLVHGDLEFPVVNPAAFELRNSDVAALQREMGWKGAQIQELQQLEAVGAALVVYGTFRRNGRLISYARAEELLDEVELVPEPGDAAYQGDDATTSDPTSAPTDSGRGDETAPPEPVA